jgi:hypothetical protein
MKRLVFLGVMIVAIVLLAVIGCSAPVVVPGKSGLERMGWGFEPSNIKIKAGETASVNITLDTLKDSGEFSFTISRVKNTSVPYPQTGIQSQDKLSMPKGLEVSIEPSWINASTYNTYHSTVSIKTTPELPAGEYVLFLELQWGLGGRSGGWITVNVE